MMKRAGKLYPRVILASPCRQPPRVRHSASSSGPAARWIAPSTPPPPSSVLLASFTIASTSSLVMSPRTMSISAAGRFILRREPINQPGTVRLTRITKSIVQTVRPALPKFHRVRYQPITAPMRWQWDWFVGEALGHFRHARVEHATRIKHFGLTRGPGAELAPNRARMKITRRFLTRSFFHFAVDTDLPIQFDPIKSERGVRICLELLPFFTLIIGKEDKAVLVESF